MIKRSTMLLTRRYISLNRKLQYMFLSNYHKSSILQELVNTVDPYCKIKISSDINVKIRPYNVFECQDSNKLRATLSSVSKKSEATMEVNVSGKNVSIVNKSTNGNTDLLCLVEVPIQADLHIDSCGSVCIDDMCNETIKVSAKNNIATKNIKSSQIDLTTIMGNIDCKGLLLGKTVHLLTKEKGKLTLDKVQGDLITCKTTEGDISTKACYVESSKFITDTGSLNLRNLHKTAEVVVNKKADIAMTGVHGNISIQSRGGNVNLQLSEISGDNNIKIDDTSSSIINISELIEKSSLIDINATKIILHESLSHLSNYLLKDTVLRKQSDNKQNKLFITTKGNVELGKLSWAERLKISMEAADKL